MPEAEGRPDYYALLGVGRDATDGSLRDAFRRLALTLHPDRHGGDRDASRRFMNVAHAYQTLIDPPSRQAYDRGLVSLTEAPFGDQSVHEVFLRVVDHVFGVRDRRKNPGRSRINRLELSLEEAVLGTNKTLELQEDSDCQHCDGRAFEPGSVPEICPRCEGCGEHRRRKPLRMVIEACIKCEGRGFVPVEACHRCEGRGVCSTASSMEVDIPAGVDGSKRLKVSGGGEKGAGMGVRGDLWIEVKVTPHTSLRREGTNIHLDRPVTVFQALTGARVRVPTVDGLRWIVLPDGCGDGELLRMKGHGVIDPLTGSRGDQMVKVRVEMPSTLPPEMCENLEKIERELHEHQFPSTCEFEQGLQGEDA